MSNHTKLYICDHIDSCKMNHKIDCIHSVPHAYTHFCSAEFCSDEDSNEIKVKCIPYIKPIDLTIPLEEWKI